LLVIVFFKQADFKIEFFKGVFNGPLLGINIFFKITSKYLPVDNFYLFLKKV